MGKNFSGNNVNGKRSKLDFYQTPYSMTKQFLDAKRDNKSIDFMKSTFLDPSCGKKAIEKVLLDYTIEKNVYSRDIFDYEQNDYTHRYNFIDSYQYTKELQPIDYIITNPPFKYANIFVVNAKKVANKGFAFLMPLSYLHGKSRYDNIFSYNDNYQLKEVYIFTRYPLLSKYLREDGKYETGMQVYAWFYWEKSYRSNPEIFWLDNNEYVMTKNDFKVFGYSGNIQIKCTKGHEYKNAFKKKVKLAYQDEQYIEEKLTDVEQKLMMAEKYCAVCNSKISYSDFMIKTSRNILSL